MRLAKLAAMFVVLSAMPSASALADEPADQRTRFLISCLDQRVSVEQGDVLLLKLLDDLMSQASDSGAAKDAAKRCTIVLDEEGIKRETLGMFDSNRQSIHFDAKLTDVRLETVLRIATQQLPSAAFFVRGECIEIVSRRRACDELHLELPHEEPPLPLPVLVHRLFAKCPVDKALHEIAERYNQNVVIAPQAAATGGTIITARLLNVPVDKAVETLATLADLKVVRRPNMFYVTTAEQAAELNAGKK